MARQLFRQEAVDAQREKFLGEISSARPVQLWVFTVLAAIIAALVIAVGIWGQYTRRERVQGYLASEIGVVPLLISEPGQVRTLTIREGQVVTQGTIIATVTVDRTTSSAASSSDVVLKELAQRRTLLEQERDATTSLGERQVDQIHKRASDLQNEIAQANAQIDLQKTRLQSARNVADRYDSLAKQHFFSEVAVQQKLDEVTDQEIKLQGLIRERAALEKEFAAARLEEPSIILRTRTQLEQISRQISELAQSSAEESLLKSTDIRAPIDGTVTNIAVSPGQTVAASAPLATIVPRDSTVRAELLVPTRAIGFVHSGQAVKLRYEAFPYERFGQYDGIVESVGKTVWMQGERVGPITVQEPTYRIIAKLDSQFVVSQGQPIALRPGMVVSADLLMEKRTLLEWLFQPVLQLRERMH